LHLAPKHFAFSSKTQGYLQQNAELLAAKYTNNSQKTTCKYLFIGFLAVLKANRERTFGSEFR
jgi:hypothetical protein